MWRAHFGRGFGPVVRQTTTWMNESFLNPNKGSGNANMEWICRRSVRSSMMRSGRKRDFVWVCVCMTKCSNKEAPKFCKHANLHCPNLRACSCKKKPDIAWHGPINHSALPLRYEHTSLWDLQCLLRATGNKRQVVQRSQL
jgi:hypothetical protein